MADLKKEIEDRLLVSGSVLQLFEREKMLNTQERKSISTQSKRIKSDTYYDVSEYTVIHTSETPIEKHIHIKSIIRGVLAMEGRELRKVIYNGTTYSEKGNRYIAEVSFTMVHSFEKTAARLFYK